MLKRILEPEIMDTEKDAIEYDSMDFSEVNEEFANSVIEFIPKSGNVLDIGCGTARIPILICEKNPNLHIMAVDMSNEMLKIAQKNIHKKKITKNITLKFADAKKLPFPNESFDAVISNSLLHHIPEPIEVLKEIKRVVRKNSVIFIKDLFRPSSTNEVNFLVEKYAKYENEYQKKLFFDSLCAALKVEEIEDMLQQIMFENLEVKKVSDRHLTIKKILR